MPFKSILSLCAALPIALSGPASARPAAYADPAAIDRLVAGFTGQPIGAMGGAKTPVDRRLRLAACPVPLSLDWHGNARNSVAVTCDDASGWRIFVNVNQAGVAAAQAPAISRGEAVTIAVQGRGFSVQQQGEALETGAIGEWIKIRTGKTSPVVRARVARPGLVVIPAG